MKKHSLLVLLPFALIITGCGGLGKGSIFNEKFMKRNFGNLETKYEREAPHKVSLDLGTGVTAVVPAQAGILTVSKDENKGYFSVYANKYVLPVDNYDAAGGMSIIHNNALDRNFFVGKKTADGVTTGVVYDDDAICLHDLLEHYLRFVDPYSIDKQGHDEGHQYRSGVYYEDLLDGVEIDSYFSSHLEKGYAIEVMKLCNFFPAESYHQDYLDKNPGGYCHVDLSLIREDEKKPKA